MIEEFSTTETDRKMHGNNTNEISLLEAFESSLNLEFNISDIVLDPMASNSSQNNKFNQNEHRLPPALPPRPNPERIKELGLDIYISDRAQPEKQDSSATFIDRKESGDMSGEQLLENNSNQNSSATVVDDFPINDSTSQYQAVLSQEQLDFQPIGNAHAGPRLPSQKRRFIGKWQLGQTIGQGSSGKVKIAKHLETNEKAVRRPKVTKLMDLSNNRDDNPVEAAARTKIFKSELFMIREACLGTMLLHPNIVRLHSAVLGENHFYCFYEYVEGEDLTDFITRQGKISESLTRDIFRRVFSAVDYIHHNGVVHRDIKLENIRYNPVKGTVKLLDFGFATFFTADELLKTNCGSPCYAAPEIYANRPHDGRLSDIWALGVCLYGMVTGTLPFDGPDFKSLAQRVHSGVVVFPSDLSQGIFQVNPKRRLSLADVVIHTWTNRGYGVKLCSDYTNDYIPVISPEWIKLLNSATIIQAGNILMEELGERVPSGKLLQEMKEFELKDDGSEEEDSNEEAEANEFLSKMTIEDKKGKKVWWKRLWNTISKAVIPKHGFNTSNVLKSIRISSRDITLEVPLPQSNINENHNRAQSARFGLQNVGPSHRQGHFRSQIVRKRFGFSK